MITTEQALELILSTTSSSQSELVKLEQASGRILRGPVRAYRNEPAISIAQRDGIALHSDTLVGGVRQFKIEGIARAGMPQQVLHNQNNCIEIMTGAPLPKNCDSVVQYEDLAIENGMAKLLFGRPTPAAYEHIAKEGAFHFKGQVLLDSGTLIRPNHLGILAAQGLDYIEVSKHPSVCIIACGDELVAVHKDPAAHQIRSSSVFALADILKTTGISNITHYHIEDKLDSVKELLSAVIESHDFVITCGGTSTGLYDFVPKALREIECQEYFYQVKQRPGKSMWYGKKNHTHIFALPGSPMASLICMRKYVLSSIHMYLAGVHYEHSRHQVVLASDIRPHRDSTLFIPVALKASDRGDIVAVACQSSHINDYTCLAASSGFIEVKPGTELVRFDELVKFYPWDASPYSEASFV